MRVAYPLNIAFTMLVTGSDSASETSATTGTTADVRLLVTALELLSPIN